MKGRRAFFAFTCVLGIVIIVFACIFDRDSTKITPRETLEYTDEMILQMPYFDLIAAAGENHNLSCDIESYSFGDGYIHLILPDNVPNKEVVVYVRDEAKNLLARRVYDFNDKVMIGDWEILLEHHNLPTIYFVSDVTDQFELMNDSIEKDIICTGQMQLYVGKELSRQKGWTSVGRIVTNSEKKGMTASLQGRGASSWEFSKKKKPYSLRLDSACNLLGMGSNKNWNLVGNPYDVSLAKSVAFNNVAKKMGFAYQPNMEYVNLYVDGTYQGVYTLTSKVSVDKERVALNKGDFFYRICPPQADQPIRYNSETWTVGGEDYAVADLVYPKEATREDLDAAYRILQDYIDAIESGDIRRIEGVCDTRMLARYYWIQEASMNIDAWERSVYMYYTQRDGRIHMGPVWDMDLALGSAFEKEGPQYPEGAIYFDTPYGWKTRKAGWYRVLLKNEDFIRIAREEYYNGGVREALESGIEEMREQKEILGSDGYLNSQFYGHSNDWEIPLSHGDTYDEYYDNMIEFYRERLNWIDKEMSNL